MWRFAQRCVVVFAVAVTCLSTQPALAIIFGGTGNKPIRDPGWPSGAVAVFNHPSRIAHWEGPPFGGGQSHAECRGDAKALNAVLQDFAKIDTKAKKIVLHDGIGRSFWINPNREPEKVEEAKIDWVFMVWIPANWERFGKVPGAIGRVTASEANRQDAGNSPVQLDVYTGGGLNWADVIVPAGIEVVDERLEAHGFMQDDGTVLEGNLIDLADDKPVKGRVELQLIEPQKPGGYRYTVTRQAEADDQGHWVLTKAPNGWYRVVARADGYVPREIGHVRFDGQPGWSSYKGELSKPAAVTGRVVDGAGKPLVDAKVRLMDPISRDSVYESPDKYEVTTDADGRFRFESVPIAKARVWVHKRGYSRHGLGPEISTPADNVELKMTPSAEVHVKVDFGNVPRPDSYIVNLTPEGGNEVGKWSGSGNINDTNEITFSDVPPGKYELVGHPNPSSADQRSEIMTLELTGGETSEVTLKPRAKQ